jgi:hypothetical protein
MRSTRSLAVYPGRYATAYPAASHPARGRAHQRVGDHATRSLDAPLERIPCPGLRSATAADGHLATEHHGARRSFNRPCLRRCLSHLHSSMAQRNGRPSQRRHRRHQALPAGRCRRRCCPFALVDRASRAVDVGDACRVAAWPHQSGATGSIRDLRVEHLRRRTGRPVANTYQALLLTPVPDPRTGSRSPSTWLRLVVPRGPGLPWSKVHDA